MERNQNLAPASGRARLAWSAALAAALSVAAPAGAATKTAPPPPQPAATAAAAPAPAKPAAAPAATKASAIPLPPPPVPRPAAAPDRVAWLGGSVGALSAFDTGSSIAMHLDYGILRTPPGWGRFDLEWHLAASFSLPSGETALTTTVTPPGAPGPVTVSAGKEKLDAFLVEVVPTARVRWNATSKLAFFGDAGLGLVQSFESYDRNELFLGHSTHKEYATGVVLRLGVGLAADVAPRWRVLLEPLAMDLMVGPKFSSFMPTLGVAYRL